MDYQKEGPVDLGEVQRMIGTSLELFQSLVDIFLEESGGQLRGIENSVYNHDPASLNNSAHSFKSSLATLGASEASNLAGQLESLGKNNRIDGTFELFTKLKLEYEKVASYFKSSQWIEDWNSLKMMN